MFRCLVVQIFSISIKLSSYNPDTPEIQCLQGCSLYHQMVFITSPDFKLGSKIMPTTIVVKLPCFRRLTGIKNLSELSVNLTELTCQLKLISVLNSISGVVSALTPDPKHPGFAYSELVFIGGYVSFMASLQ